MPMQVAIPKEANSTNITAIVEPLRRLPNIMNVSKAAAHVLP